MGRPRMSAGPPATRVRPRLVPVGRPVTTARPRPARRPARPDRLGVLGHVRPAASATYGWPPWPPTSSSCRRCCSFPPRARPSAGARSATRRIGYDPAGRGQRPASRRVARRARARGPSYTVDTLVELHGRHPDVELVLIMAADSLAQVGTWRSPLSCSSSRLGRRTAARLGVAAARRAGETVGASSLPDPPPQRSRARHQRQPDPASRGGWARHPLPCAAGGRGAHRRAPPLPPLTGTREKTSCRN